MTRLDERFCDHGGQGCAIDVVNQMKRGETMSHMIPNPEETFRHLVPTGDTLLRELEKEAEVEGIPIVCPVVGELLYLLARISKATRILELGCATGYSAIHLARALDAPEGRLITLENNQDMAARAQANFRKDG